MLSTRKRHAALVSLLFAFVLLWFPARPAAGQTIELAPGDSADPAAATPADSGVAADDEPSGSPLEPLVPETLNGYALNEVDAMNGRPLVRAQYQPETDEGRISFAISYGKDAADRYRELRGRAALAAAEGELAPDTVSVQGRTVFTFHSDDRSVASAYFDHFFLGIYAEGLGASENPSVDLLKAVDLDRFAEWSPPDDVDYTLAETEPDASSCIGMDCFSERVTQCEEGQLIGALDGRAVRYAVEGPAGSGQCRLSFVLTDGRNEDLENAPLYFTVDSEGGFSLQELKTAMEACFEGDGKAYDCEGPFLDRMPDR